MKNRTVQRLLGEYDSAVGTLINRAHLSFLGGAAFGGFAAGEASGSVAVGVAAGIAIEAIGYGKTRLSAADYLTSVRATIAETQSTAESINEATNRIVAVIEEMTQPADQ